MAYQWEQKSTGSIKSIQHVNTAGLRFWCQTSGVADGDRVWRWVQEPVFLTQEQYEWALPLTDAWRLGDENWDEPIDVFLMETIPLEWLIPKPGQATRLDGILPATILNGYSLEGEFSPSLACYVKSEAVAELYSQSLGIKVRRHDLQTKPKPGDTLIAGIFTSPRQLAEGQTYTEQEMISIPIAWVRVRI